MKVTLKRMNTEAYATADTFFRSKDFQNITKDYFNYVYTSSLDYLETGDVNILNRVMAAAKLAQRVKITSSLIGLVAAHPKVAGKYKGKANAKQLTTKRNSMGELKAKQEGIINADTELRAVKKATFDADQAQTRAVNAIAALLAHDIKVDVTELVKLATHQRDKIKTKAKVKGTPATPIAVPAEL